MRHRQLMIWTLAKSNVTWQLTHFKNNSKKHTRTKCFAVITTPGKRMTNFSSSANSSRARKNITYTQTSAPIKMAKTPMGLLASKVTMAKRRTVKLLTHPHSYPKRHAVSAEEALSWRWCHSLVMSTRLKSSMSRMLILPNGTVKPVELSLNYLGLRWE